MSLWERLTGRKEEDRVGHEEGADHVVGAQPDPWRSAETERLEQPWAGVQAEQTATGAHGEHLPPPAREIRFAAPRPAEPNPIVDSGVHVVPPVEEDSAPRCEHCGGRMPGDHELLADVAKLIGPHGPEAMRRFYERLFEVAPDLRELFPTRIEVQEEKLLSAITALLTLFQAGDEEMEQLDAALARFGRSHTRFEPAATIEEYAAVWKVLAEVLVVMLGEKLTERHVKALRRAYEYAAGKMLAAQSTARFTGTGRRRRTV